MEEACGTVLAWDFVLRTGNAILSSSAPITLPQEQLSQKPPCRRLSQTPASHCQHSTAQSVKLPHAESRVTWEPYEQETLHPFERKGTEAPRDRDPCSRAPSLSRAGLPGTTPSSLLSRG